MPELEEHAEGEDAGEAAGAEAAAAQAESEAVETPRDESTEPGSDWPDLDGYREQLRADHAEWSERLSAIGVQLAALRPALVGIAAQQRALAIEEDLDRLNEVVLGGAAAAQSLRLGYGLERYLALIWPAALDPRPGLAQAEHEGEYRVEVFLHLGPDGRARIRVEGARRLEAPLPTSRARLRGVLLSAMQNPKRVAPGGVAEEEPAAAAPTANAGPEAKEPPADDRPAAPRPGDSHEVPPPEEQVIPLGPSEEHRPDDESGEASRSG